MKTEAAILIETGKPLALCEIEIPPLKDGQVLVDVSFSGVCHTQVLECNGFRGEDKYIPHCLGHEGSGIVSEIGKGVTKVKPGDKVILSWMKGSGDDVPGTIYRWNNLDVNAGAITTFSRKSVISENRITPIAEEFDIPLDKAALLGCMAATGLGSVFNVAKPKPRQSIAIFGAGGIGLCAIAAAQIKGCKPVIAVDINEEKLKAADKAGASHCINASALNPVEEINKICRNGVDFAIECCGLTKVMLQAIDSIRKLGGTAIIVGNAPFGEKLCIDPRQFNLGKKVLGTWGGDNNPDKDFLKYIQLVLSGKLNLDMFTSDTYKLSDINNAIKDLEKGKVIRPLINMSMG